MNISRRRFLASSTVASLLAGGRHLLGDDQHEEAKPAPNAFLSENFAPVREEIEADNLPVVGKLPQELNGMFVRNGPNPQFPPKLNYHWFDGDGMLHGVRLQDGKASYRNRWVRTAAWQQAHQAGQSVYPSILDPPDLKVFLQRLLSGDLPYPNTANTALVWHHGKLLALWEGGPPHEIKVPSLETVGPYTFGAKLKHAFTAHPKVDPRTGELIFFGYSPVLPFVQYSVADSAGTIQHTTPIQLPRPVMIHDIAITQNYSLLIDCPMIFDATAVARGKPFIRYESKYGARIGVLPRYAKGDQVQWFSIQPCFIFHIFNAHEEGNHVVLHGCRFPEYPEFVDFGEAVEADSLEDSANATLPIAYRWRMNLETGDVTETPLQDVVSEFPRVNEQFTGSQTRYGYAVGREMNKLLKFDFEQGACQAHPLAKSEVSGEGVFVPRADAKTEDDGWLVSFTHSRAEGKSELRVIDCQALTSEPVARVRLPQRVPYGFHAVWLPDHVL